MVRPSSASFIRRSSPMSATCSPSRLSLPGKALDLRFGPAIHVEIDLTPGSVFLILPILAHHDDGRLDGRDHGEKEIEQNERVRIPSLISQVDVDRAIDDQYKPERDYERPRPTEACNRIRN